MARRSDHPMLTGHTRCVLLVVIGKKSGKFRRQLGDLCQLQSTCVCNQNVCIFFYSVIAFKHIYMYEPYALPVLLYNLR